MSGLRIAFVPPVPALLSSYAGGTDAVADLRAAALGAVGWLVEERPADVVVLGDGLSPADVQRGVSVPLAERVAEELLHASGWRGGRSASPAAGAVLVLANGSARRGEKAPGHLDERAFGFDEWLGKALAAGDAARLADLEEPLARDLLAAGAPALRSVAGLVTTDVRTETRYAGDPFGVQYWVVTWQCAS